MKRYHIWYLVLSIYHMGPSFSFSQSLSFLNPVSDHMFHLKQYRGSVLFSMEKSISTTEEEKKGI